MTAVTLNLCEIYADAEKTLQNLRPFQSRGQLRAVSLPNHDGSTSLDEFIAAYDGLVPVSECATIKMIRLKESCKGRASELIRRIANNESGYQEARRLLKETYGGSARDNPRYLRDARHWPQLRSNDHTAIIGYRNFEQSLVSSITGTASEAELGDGSLYAILLDKLSVAKKSQYFRWLEDDAWLCQRDERCGTGDCRANHNPMLHDARPRRHQNDHNQSVNRTQNETDSEIQKSGETVSLRTIPVCVTGNGVQMKINA